jgi:itaconate CoA-transferase
MGFSYEQLKEHYPKLIVCDISGYGSSGPYRDKKAYDLLIQAESGLLSVTGSDDEPAKAGCSIVDISAGMYAFSNILAAIIRRHKTGTGCCIDISMLETMTEWMSFPMYYAYQGAEPPARAGASHATIYPYGPFPVGDGNSVMLGLQNEREWAIFCDQVLQQPELKEDVRFSSNTRRSEARSELRSIIVEVFSKMTLTTVTQRLDAARIGNASMNSMEQVWNHAQLAARDRWRFVDSPNGPVKAMLPPGAPEEFSSRMDPIPESGEHSREILTELGYSKQDIEELEKLRVI